MIGLLVCSFTYLLRAVDFAPLRLLVSFEDRLYEKLIPPALELKNGFHPIILVDIDGEAMRKWGAPRGAASGTPRTLIADLTRVLRHAGAAVIFLDYDLRIHLRDDSALREELAKPSDTPVLLPMFFSSGILPQCEEQSDDHAPIELETIFDSSSNIRSVVSVHSIVALGAYGLVDGTCSSYRVRVGDTEELVSRQAAMLRAVELAQLSPRRHTALADHSRPYLIPTRWWVQNDTQLLHDQTGRLAYARIHASLYVRKNTIDTGGVDLSALENAVVIVSSTHRWSEDLHATPVGYLSGALVQANLGLGIQSYPSKEIPLLL
jgi:CHASE2 domain-containing sensor protein